MIYIQKILTSAQLTQVVLIFSSLIIGLLSVSDMPLFSDSAFHASVIREIQTTGNFLVHSPVGWVALDMHPLSYLPYLTHPPQFYLLNTSLVLLGFNIKTSLSITSILPTILTVFFFYKLVDLYFDNRIALISSLLLVFMPMSVWLISHRIMEPLQYLLSISGLLYLKRFIDNPKKSYIVLASIFFSVVLYIKITSLFIVVAAVIYLLISRINFKSTFIFCFLVFALYVPYMIFAINTRGSISYSPPGLPIFDKHIFNPWWEWEITDREKELNTTSNYEEILMRLGTYDRNKRSFIQDDFQARDYSNILQKYNIMPISMNANPHWFSPELSFTNFYLLLFLAGCVIYIVNYRSSQFHNIIVPLLIFTTYYFTLVAEIRYFYVLNILMTVITAIAFLKLLDMTVSRLAKIFLVSSLVISLSLISVSELKHSYQYKYSLSHNIMSKGNGLAELPKAIPYIDDSHASIYTSANSEVSYYLNRRTVWDPRLFFIPESQIDIYLDLYEVDLILLPKYLFRSHIYDYKTEKELVNSVFSWQGNSIPLDSGFYKYLNSDRVTHVGEYNTFYLYRRVLSENYSYNL